MFGAYLVAKHHHCENHSSVRLIFIHISSVVFIKHKTKQTSIIPGFRRTVTQFGELSHFMTRYNGSTHLVAVIARVMYNIIGRHTKPSNLLPWNNTTSSMLVKHLMSSIMIYTRMPKCWSVLASWLRKHSRVALVWSVNWSKDESMYFVWRRTLQKSECVSCCLTGLESTSHKRQDGERERERKKIKCCRWLIFGIADDT